MGHDHRAGGAHAGHDHGAAGSDERRVRIALAITALFMVAEVAGGILSGSLALLADAGHMLTDTGALLLALYAFRMSARPATPERSFGHHRQQVLSAFINGGVLIGVAVWIVIEAARRLASPEPILGGPMLAVAAAGLVANVAAFLVLHGGSRGNLNLEGAALHVLSDLLGSVAAIAAAGVVLLTGWTPIDPILSVLVAVLILRSAWRLASKSWHVLMEGAPAGFDVGRLRTDLIAAVPGVADIHHVHAWSLTPERPLITLHARITPAAEHDNVLAALQEVLANRFGFGHATIQVERTPQVRPPVP
jgi:cobalt-zinc-cadmium efflux system protein